MESLCSKCNRASGCSDIFGITGCSGYGRVVGVRSDCNWFAEKKVAISIDAEAQQAINLLKKNGYSIEQIQAAWRILDNNQQESVNV
jgi:hypothetical protein